jgi:hypothetical protein
MAQNPADGHRGRMMQGDPRVAMGGQPQVDSRVVMSGQPSASMPASKQQMEYHSMQMYKTPSTMRQHPGTQSTGRRLLILTTGLRSYLIVSIDRW